MKYCGASTSNMLKHINGVHGAAGGLRNVKKGQRQLTEFAQASFCPTSVHAKRITESLCEYIIRDLRPLNTGEGDGFKIFCMAMNPR